jgi:hypothetical protein
MSLDAIRRLRASSFPGSLRKIVAGFVRVRHPAVLVELALQRLLELLAVRPVAGAFGDE